jgi:hypothetical protein
MSKLDDPKQAEMLRHWAEKIMYQRKPALKAFETSEEMRHWIVDFIEPATPLTYLEFGVAHGDSIKFFSERFRHEGSSFFGFDSFLGIPEAWLHLPKFHFNRDGEAPHFDDSRVNLIKGWFQNTVPGFLSGWQRSPGKVMVHYDADLYGSTLFAMTMLWPRVQEYFFLFDDFLADDSVALFDFAAAYPIEIEFLAQAGKDGTGALRPVKTFGRIRNVGYTPSSD